jgi:pimeloyl-ACP methyl ester carboxylesterase
MLDGFDAVTVDVGETSLFARMAGEGPPVLLLHGFPETHLMWRDIAPILARRFAVVCADLRGYGRSGCPPSSPDHGPYSKRARGSDMVRLMARLGFARFMVAGHDRGARVAYRMALDHPASTIKLAVLDTVPTAAAWDRADARLALAFWPWSLLAQPAPLPERLIEAAAEAVIDNAVAQWGSRSEAFPAEVKARPCACTCDLRGVSGGGAPRSRARLARYGAGQADRMPAPRPVERRGRPRHLVRGRGRTPRPLAPMVRRRERSSSGRRSFLSGRAPYRDGSCSRDVLRPRRGSEPLT